MKRDIIRGKIFNDVINKTLQDANVTYLEITIASDTNGTIHGSYIQPSRDWFAQHTCRPQNFVGYVHRNPMTILGGMFNAESRPIMQGTFVRSQKCAHDWDVSVNSQENMDALRKASAKIAMTVAEASNILEKNPTIPERQLFNAINL